MQSLVNDILSDTDSNMQRVLLEKIGELSIFFGRKSTIDNLIPLINSCLNKKEFMLRVPFLQLIYIDGLLERDTLTRTQSRETVFSLVLIDHLYIILALRFSRISHISDALDFH